MVIIRKLRNEKYSVYSFINDVISSVYPGTKVLDAYPYNEIENDTLQVPSVSVEAEQTMEEPIELGSYGFRRNWTINVFANSDTQRDELADAIFQALGADIPIKNYSGGLVDNSQPIIEYARVYNRRMEPVKSFDEYARIKYWRMIIRFTTITTLANE